MPSKQEWKDAGFNSNGYKAEGPFTLSQTIPELGEGLAQQLRREYNQRQGDRSVAVGSELFVLRAVKNPSPQYKMGDMTFTHGICPVKVGNEQRYWVLVEAVPFRDRGNELPGGRTGRR